MKLSLLVPMLLISCSLNSIAQVFVGITADFGNAVKYSPHDEELLKRSITPSGSVAVIIQELIKENWHLQYGGSIGTLGYKIGILAEFDTLSVGNDPNFYSSYPNYNTIYAGGNLAFGKQIVLNKYLPNLYLFLGGGFTYYYESFTSGRSSRCEVDPCEVVFEYNMQTTSTQIKGFVESSAQAHLRDWLLLGLRYRHSFEPALKGSYNLYHVENPPNGSVSLVQRALSIMVLLRI